MSNKGRYTVTAALPYTNGPIHIGHLAGVYIPADIYSRYLRLNGHDVAFICGSDEHGVPIRIKAMKEGVQPKEIIDRYHKVIKKSFEDFGISFDIYSRTSSETHRTTSQGLFKKIYEDNIFEEKNSEQFYDSENNQFLADRFIVGTCPKCGYDNCYGDQCEKCGTSHNSLDLINPKSTLSGEKPILKKTKHWYLPLDKYQKWLEEWFKNENKKEWRKNVLGQVKSWFDDQLRPRAVTRDLDWGVPVPIEGVDGKVLYVWFEAPIGYISATKEWAKKNNKNWEDYWKDEDTNLIHFIGKDNIVFHCIIFPVILKALGDFILPTNVPANEFLNLEGNKLSTSKNWAVWLHEYLEDFPKGKDTLRYVLTSNAPEAKDNDFTWKDFQAKNNNELVAILGNFVNRVIVLAHKYFEGKVPENVNCDIEQFNEIENARKNIGQLIEKFEFRNSLESLMNLARYGNKYLQEREPWKTVKTDHDKTKETIFVSLQICSALALLGEPFLPDFSNKLKDILSLKKIPWNEIVVRENSFLIKSGTEIKKSPLIFEKVEDSQIENQLNKIKEPENKEEDKSDSKIEFSDFDKMDLRTSKIISAEKLVNADKLLKLEVDTGIDKRVILSGIAEFYEPDELIGKSVLVLVNLKPRKIRGVESNGMILMADDKNGKPIFISSKKCDIQTGLKIG